MHLVFDMDGVLANLYAVPNWESQLRAEIVTPYEIAEPLIDMVKFVSVLSLLKAKGHKVAITSWCSKNGSKEYDKAVARAKKEWLDRYSIPYDEAHFLHYGRTKADATRAKGGYQLLFDDNAKIRAGWHLGNAVDGSKNLLETLENLLTNGSLCGII